MSKCGKALMATTPADQSLGVLVCPGKQTLHHPAGVVRPECATALRCRPNAVLEMWGDQLNSLGCQQLIEQVIVVGTISHNSLGASHGDRLSEHRFEKDRFMRRGRSRVHGEWKTSSVCDFHQLRTFVRLRLSNFGAPFFATLKVPSMKHR